MSVWYNERLARQLIVFSGISCGTATPTDIDGFMEKGGEKFLFYEFKTGETPVPFGQRLALEHVADACRMAGKKAAVLVCRHENHDGSDVIAKDAVVDEVYFDRKWYKYAKRPTVKAVTESFMGVSA